MNTTSRTITGTLAVIFGLFLTILGIFKDLWVLIYGVPMVVIGIFIFLNKKEDNIEQIKGRENYKNK